MSSLPEEDVLRQVVVDSKAAVHLVHHLSVKELRIRYAAAVAS